MSEVVDQTNSESKSNIDIHKPKIKLKKAPVLFSQTQESLKELCKILDCPVLTYFKPSNGNIWSQDLYAIHESLKIIGKVPKLALFIRSDGGAGTVSLRIIHLLRSYADKLILLAPAECASAATMLALGCDEIQMGPLSSLSPVDSSLVHQLSPVDKLNQKVSVSLDELGRVVRLWKEADKDKVESVKKSTDKSTEADNPYKYLYQYIHPLVFGSVDRHSSLSKQICHEILSYHITDKQLIEEITDKLNNDYPAHGYPITDREATKIGLPVARLSHEALEVINKLQLLYAELCNEQVTDYDRFSFHDNTIYSILETNGLQIAYNHNFDKFYLESEKRYLTTNDLSGWTKTTVDNNSKPKSEKLYF